MKKTDWKQIAELVGIAAIVASLLFVGLQMQLDRRIAETQAYMESSATGIELSQLLNENREVWIKGLRGDELSDVENSIFSDLFGTVHQRKAAIWERRVRLGAGNPDTWAEDYAYEIYVYPGLRREFQANIDHRKERRALFGRSAPVGNFSQAVQRALSELDRSGPQVLKELVYTLR